MDDKIKNILYYRIAKQDHSEISFMMINGFMGSMVNVQWNKQ